MIVIIGILAVIAVPAYFANIEKARTAEATSTLSAIRQAEVAYYAANAAYTLALPITVVMDGDTIVNLAAPISPNFVYSISGAVADPCLVATKQGSSANSHSMQTSSGKVYATATCS